MSARRSPWLYILSAVLLCALPLVCNAYWLDVCVSIGLYALLALSLNVILGQAGIFHMGHAAFFAVGAYATAILNTVYHWPVLWVMPLAGAAAAVVALVVARPIIHLRGDYLLIVTIGIVEIVRIALINDIFGLTGGSNGIFGIARPRFFGFKIVKSLHFYYLVWGMVGVSLLLFYGLWHSRFGRALNYIKEDDVADHHMHSEYYEVTPEQAEAINAARARGGRIVCVGTTSVRTLETVATEDGVVHPGSGFTQIFITPGVKIKAVDALITNFHLPQSTLLMLISALMGRENALDVYRQAVEERYRFFSFGDAMMITGKPQKDI